MPRAIRGTSAHPSAIAFLTTTATRMRAASRMADVSRAKSPTISRPICAGSPPPASTAMRPSRRRETLAQGHRRAERGLRRGNAGHCRWLRPEPRQASRCSMRATSWRSPCSARRRRSEELLASSRPDGCTTFGLTPQSDRRSPHLARPELGLARRRAWPHLRAARAAHGASRASSASPRPASPAARWASTNAGSALSRTVSPRATTAAILMQAVPRALPRGARRRTIRRGDAAGDRRRPAPVRPIS